METLINIDNGGTLTDICVWDGTELSFTKTLTTPHDLSECLFAGIEKASAKLYGDADLTRLLHQAQHIRYSTTQGTNALVERKGPMIGVVTTIADLADRMVTTPAAEKLRNGVIGDRFLVVDPNSADLEFDAVQLVNRLTTLGAARVVIVGSDPDQEHTLRHILLRKFPRHLLGSVPLIYSWELAGDRDAARRTWSCVINAFLHPTMERFLYGAERRLKEYKVANPLLVYRNDGASSRVAKSIALKTYSSGPRGGLEGTAALAKVYGLRHALMMDIGGTTTDVGVVGDNQVLVRERGAIEGVDISYAMSDVGSTGVGGSSVIEVVDGRITVGPQSVGAAPGPACFGFGGKQATITDVNLLLGVLDPDTYLDGTFTLDPERSRAVITETVARPLGVSLEEALVRMENAYFTALAGAFERWVEPDTTLLAFGGAGPMSAAGAARLAGVRRVLIPRTAAVFSAFGIAFSDIGKTYEVILNEATPAAATQAYAGLAARAERDMFQEGYALTDCDTDWQLVLENLDDGSASRIPYTDGDEVEYPGHALSLELTVTARLPHPELDADRAVTVAAAPSSGTRAVRSSAERVDEVAVHVLDDLSPGHVGEGPAIIEGPFFTARVLPGWYFQVTAAGDLLLSDHH
ncbi:hydantoinase/oxoprolinase family protein [Gordonia pseudamarae]|jgi:N-methylhydantoinase A|uniref:Hydantoinase/oxoprolinase family protein n=1 Tax=Gordonia pseudamarae TaxID=2831662 RepID=A0ABX6IFP5_9ACTN|nr:MULTISPECIES: hydantoinase/oxoprolinase family protein [Gordonia]MBD0022301.1 hydantoinase/oxoprolinase family protein [Gordonia sp. (in: high G+C Gram-positive bacteria)]QHN25006.1 hydantoinase/oxoprolinase family protein [Gordonia pseudamarae]QHN33941.1 hydantoinase/oxoprolinase family protein [Gordonia pseudamarae]